MFKERKYSLKNKYTFDIEPHEVFLDNLAKHKESESGFSEKKFETPLRKNVIYFVFLFFLFIIILFFYRIFTIQILNGEKFFILAENNKGKISLITPERGIIYDRNMKKMVSNAPSFDLFCDKRKFSNVEGELLFKIKKISEIVDIDYYDLEKIILESSDQLIMVSENLTHEKMLVLESKIGEIPECYIEGSVIRNYFLGEAFSHLLGYVGRVSQDEFINKKSYAINDKSGKSGIEKFYEDYLRGTPGKIELQKTAIGIERGKKIISEPLSGDNIVLNIDSELQLKIYEELEKGIKNVGSQKGSVVAMNPKNGQVLSIVSYPSYDNNLFSKGISVYDFNLIINNKLQPFFNRAISSRYPTGSTIKPFEAIAALQEGIISPDKLINDIGYIEIKSKYDSSVVYRFGGVKPHGLVDMRKALAVSSNIYFYTIGGGYENQKGLGPTKLGEYLSLFGWGSSTGIDLIGEYSGFIPSPDWKKSYKKENWWDGDTYNLSIGQSDLQVTPIQLAVAYSAIANNGTLYKPQILNKIISNSCDLENNLIKEFKPEIIRENFIDKKNIEIVKEGMRDSVRKSYGSAYFLNNLPVNVAAKTGTAEIGKDGYYNTWVSVFGPYEDPEIVLIVTIEEVEGLRSGSLTVANEILKWFFNNKN